MLDLELEYENLYRSLSDNQVGYKIKLLDSMAKYSVEKGKLELLNNVTNARLLHMSSKEISKMRNRQLLNNLTQGMPSDNSNNSNDIPLDLSEQNYQDNTIRVVWTSMPSKEQEDIATQDKDKVVIEYE